ncbi:aminopeptidase [Actinomadura rubrobrunea]|uniref:Aminotransferase n=1 Tax=Actinomadura rubrobrunea TaxID=115335 RepID=A0A9W6PVB6_9ACTN|nr:pyridoxal phosphate-dependent aminotransferase [Actinomadura rubrobrunea]GLW65159.1 aminopeptidase [Actinomadura rubrobrunea]
MLNEQLGVAANFAVHQTVANRRAAGADILDLSFGESLLPVHPSLVERLAQGSVDTDYGPIAGDGAARAAAAGYFARRGLPTDPDQIVFAPGSKPLLLAVVAAVDGDVMLPSPTWVSYAPQARLLGRAAFPVPTPSHCGGVPDPDALRLAVRAARARRGRPRLVVLTLPDNPSGTLAPPAVVRRVCEVALAEGLTVVSDEIYRDLAHDGAPPLLSPAEVIPERTVVVTGLSKSHGIGGWRIGLARFPRGRHGAALRAGVVAAASEIWSTLARPMQAVAELALSEPPEIRAHLAAAARLHGTVAAAVHEVITAAGARCLPPQGGFYLYPDLEGIRDVLADKGVTTAADLQDHLLDRHGIAVLGGHLFGDKPRALRVRIATSLLYGDTPKQRWQTLHAADPLSLPHVRKAVDRIGAAFRALSSPARCSAGGRLVETAERGA